MIDRRALVAWYEQNRARSRQLFDLLEPSAYYTRPIALRNPIVFYEGHLPAFSLISLVKRGLGCPGVDERLEQLFARGIDPDSESDAVPRSGRSTVWPSRDAVLEFAARADALVIDALEHAAFDLDGRTHPAMRGGEAIYTALEHEAMHQETLLYMWHRLPHAQKRKPSTLAYELGDAPPNHGTVKVPAGTATLGASRASAAFGWDNEFDEHRVDVPAFDIDIHSVTNADFRAFIESGGYSNRSLWSAEGWEWVSREGVTHPAFWVLGGRERAQRVSHASGAGQGAPASARLRQGSGEVSPQRFARRRKRVGESEGRSPSDENDYAWRGMFEDIPLPLAWPVYVSHAEASAYARWKGRRLPSEAEYHRAAFATPDGSVRTFPWGDEAPDPTRGNFDFRHWEPVPAGSRPAGASAWGVQDLAGNGWEWTDTIFAPFPGFVPMASYPEYSADFFDGRHYVMKGASPATARPLIRRSFRNWFRSNYPYVYAKFRTVSSSQ